ncbi:TRAP transporter small permease [Chloroflexota bacterium]
MGKFIDFTTRGGMAVSCALLGVLIVFVTTSVISRYVFNAPIISSDELSEYIFAGVCLLGLGYAMQVGRHIRVEVIADLLPVKMQKYLTKGLTVILLFYVLLFLIATTYLAWTYGMRGMASNTILRTPLVWPVALIPLGALIMLLEIIRSMFRRSP